MEERKNPEDHEEKVHQDNRYVDDKEPVLSPTMEEGDEDYDDEELADRHERESKEASRH